MAIWIEPRSARVAAGLLAVAGVAWLAMIRWSHGMQPAPGTMGLRAPGFVALWTVMMAAMMLPALSPLATMYAGSGTGKATRVTGLAAGYLLAWTGFGLVALLASHAAASLASEHERGAVWLGAATLVGAGLYQLSPLKGRCLAVCRSPLHLLMRMARYRGPTRHLRAGLHHGLYCIGCCWSLMVALIVLGFMDLRWMVLFAAVITLEKLSRRGQRVAVVAGIGLIVLGVLAPWHPGLIPGLHQPLAPMMRM